MITSLIEMLELPNSGLMTTSTISLIHKITYDNVMDKNGEVIKFI